MRQFQETRQWNHFQAIQCYQLLINKTKENHISVTEQTDMLLELNEVLISCLIKINPVCKYQWGSWHNSTPFPRQKEFIHLFLSATMGILVYYPHTTYVKDLQRLCLSWNSKYKKWIIKKIEIFLKIICWRSRWLSQ